MPVLFLTARDSAKDSARDSAKGSAKGSAKDAGKDPVGDTGKDSVEDSGKDSGKDSVEDSGKVAAADSVGGSARDCVEDRIAGLTAGGDDHVTKPFGLEDVVARLRGLIRRSGAASARSASVLVVGDLTLDEDSHEVTRGGDGIHLTATEFELLRFLMRNPRRVLSKAQILDRVWSYDFVGHANVVELYISYLRRKIDAGRSR